MVQKQKQAEKCGSLAMMVVLADKRQRSNPLIGHRWHVFCLVLSLALLFYVLAFSPSPTTTSSSPYSFSHFFSFFFPSPSTSSPPTHLSSQHSPNNTHESNLSPSPNNTHLSHSPNNTHESNLSPPNSTHISHSPNNTHESNLSPSPNSTHLSDSANNTHESNLSPSPNNTHISHSPNNTHGVNFSPPNNTHISNSLNNTHEANFSPSPNNTHLSPPSNTHLSSSPNNSHEAMHLSPSPSASASPSPHNTSQSLVVSNKTIDLLPPLPSPYNDSLYSSPAHNKNILHCNLAQGKWIPDKTYPLYPPSSCPFVEESFSCQKNGRPDLSYASWRWVPDECDLPRFNAGYLLESLRGKRVSFVGDSLNRNQYESLVCLLWDAAINKNKVYEPKLDQTTSGTGSSEVLFEDYNLRIEFYRSNFLVEERRITEENVEVKELLYLDKIDILADKWRESDILIFNTGHWWTHWKTGEGLDSFHEGGKVLHGVSLLEAYTKAIHTWATWLDAHINPSATRVFFRTYSPSHFHGGQWNSGGQCHNESWPIYNEAYLSPYPEKMIVVEEALRRIKLPVKVVNVTRLSDFRKDAHPSIYGHRQTLSIEDCSHWCLPGLPDTWNEMLLAYVTKPDYYL